MKVRLHVDMRVWLIRAGNMPSRRSRSRRNPGLGWPARWIRRPITARNSYKGSGRLLGRKALITGGDSGMGRAAAIAFAREGADVVINYLPAEQEDADQVLALIKDCGRKGFSIPGDLREEAFCQKLVADAVEKLGGSGYRGQQCRASAELRVTSPKFHLKNSTPL